MKRVFKKEFFGKEIIVEHGELAKQATSAVLVRYGDTAVLSTVVVNKEADSSNITSVFFFLQRSNNSIISLYLINDPVGLSGLTIHIILFLETFFLISSKSNL